VNAEPVGIESEAVAGRGDGQREIVFLEKPEGEDGAAASAVAAQIGNQHVVAQRERAESVQHPLAGVAALSVEEQNRRPRLGLAG
jgi:hypothetical protein